MYKDEDFAKVVRGQDGKFVSKNSFGQRGTIVFGAGMNKSEAIKDANARDYVVIDKGDYAELRK